MLRWWKANWGFGIFLLDVVLALASLWLRVTGHYINYTEPARYLWRHEDPYGITFPGSPGAFFYSPGCALFFYGPFAQFPSLFGQFLYMTLSAGVFSCGLKQISEVLRQQFGLDIRTSYYRHLFWLMAGSEVLGSIIAVKIDLLIVGAVFWTVANLLTNRYGLVSLFAMGILTSWKLHPFALFGLILLPYFFQKRWKEPVSYLSGTAAGFLSPLLVLSSHQTISFTRHWIATLNEYVADAWLAPIFQHIYGFLARGFAVDVNIHISNKITAAAGTSMAVFVGWFFLIIHRQEGLGKAQTKSVLLALALGSAFIVVFSHLIQSNSYVTYLPLPLVLIAFAGELGWNQRRTVLLLIVCYWTISIAYSDLTPRPIYHFLYHAGIKPLGVLALLIALVIATVRLTGSHLAPFQLKSR